MSRLIGALAGLALLAAAPAGAAECEGFRFPDTLNLGGKTLVLNGLGLREATVFMVDVYVAALYVAARSGDAAAVLAAPGAKRLVLHFLRDVDLEDITGAWNEGFAKTAGEGLGALEGRIATLNAWMATMKEGQRLVFTSRAGVEVEVAGKVRGTIPGDDFARAFLAIWLGPEPPNEGLKSGLLGGACGG